MAYKVLIDFKDLEDKKSYKAGDWYEPKEKDEGRIASLLTDGNASGRPLIAWVDNPEKDQEESKKKPKKKAEKKTAKKSKESKDE